jgi:hypothetical protein
MPMTALQRTQARGFLADQGTSAQQTVEIQNATGGTFTLNFGGQTTVAIPYLAGANVVQNALAALSTIGVGNVAVVENTGLPGVVFLVVNFTGTLAHAAQPMLTIDTSGLSGIGIIASITQVFAGGVTAFADADLDMWYDFAAGYGTANFALAVAFCWDELLGGGAKFNDYVAGQSNEKKSQITDHLKERSEWWHQWSNADRQIQPTRMVSEPPRLRAVPVSSGTPATSLRYGPGDRGPFRGRGPW